MREHARVCPPGAAGAPAACTLAGRPPPARPTLRHTARAARRGGASPVRAARRLCARARTSLISRLCAVWTWWKIHSVNVSRWRCVTSSDSVTSSTSTPARRAASGGGAKGRRGQSRTRVRGCAGEQVVDCASGSAAKAGSRGVGGACVGARPGLHAGASRGADRPRLAPQRPGCWPAAWQRRAGGALPRTRLAVEPEGPAP